MKRLVTIAIILTCCTSIYALDSITKPYTFYPNTKANSSEVNSNFDTVYNGTNNAISAINSAAGSKASLDARLDASLNEDGTLKQYVHASSFANLSTAKASIGSAEKTLYIDQDTTANTVTLGDNITLKKAPGAKITIASGKTLTINGHIDPVREQYFAGSGRVAYGHKTEKVYPEWRGVVAGTAGKGDADNDTALRATMLDIAASGGGHLEFGSGTYWIRVLVIDTDNVIVSGQGQATILKNDPYWDGNTMGWGHLVSVNGPIATKYDNAHPYSIAEPHGDPAGTTVPISNIIIKDFKVVWDASTLTTPESVANINMNGVAVANVTHAIVENVYVDMNFAQKAFAVSGYFTDVITRDVTIKNCNSVKSRWGVQIYNDYSTVKNAIIDGVNIVGNTFDLATVDEVYDYLDDLGISDPNKYNYNDEYGVALWSINEVSGLRIVNNSISNGKIGIHIGRPSYDYYPKSPVLIEGNLIKDFTQIGLLAYCGDPKIINNTFDSELMEYDSTDAWEMAGVSIRSYSYYYKGPSSTILNSNTFKNLYSATADGSHYVVGVRYVPPRHDSQLVLVGNDFAYDNGHAAYRDLLFSGQSLNKGICYVAGNKFNKDTTNTRISNGIASFLLSDGGGNQNMTLYYTTATMQGGTVTPQNTTITTAGTTYSTATGVSLTAYMSIGAYGTFTNVSSNHYTLNTGYNVAMFDERMALGNFTLIVDSTTYYCTATAITSPVEIAFDAYTNSGRTVPFTGSFGTNPLAFDYSVGSGLIGTVTAASGPVTALTITTLGTGYRWGDIIHIPGGDGTARATYNIQPHYFPKGYVYLNYNPSVDGKGMINTGWYNTTAGYGGIWTPVYTSNVTPVTP